MSGARTIEVRRLGRVEYEDGLALQEALAASVGSGSSPDTLLLLEHDPVVTLGRGARDARNLLLPPADLAARGITVHETTRGGDVTWHGPGQLVGYPVFDLARTRETKDVRRFVRSLEELMIRVCADFGVTATRDAEHTGVWVGPDKIGAIGVRVGKWVTTHGFALNVSPDLSSFDLIVPCGISGRGVTSLSRELGRDVAIDEVEARIAVHAASVFDANLRDREVPLGSVAVAIRRGEQHLVLRRVPARGGFWQIVTGRIEPGESPLAAAARELGEETGIEGASVRPLGYEHGFGLGLPTLAPGEAPRFAREACFVATVPPDAKVRLSDEHDELAWMDLEAAVARVRFAGHRRALRLAAAARLR